MFTPDIPLNFNSPDIINLFNRFNINPSSTQKIGRNTYLLHSFGQPIVLKSSLSSYQLDSIVFALDCISSVFPSLTTPNVIDSTYSSSSNCLLLLSYVSGQSLTTGDYGAVFRSLTSGSSSLLQSFRSLDPLISIDSRGHFFHSMSSQITNMIADNPLYSPLLSYFNAGPPDKSPSLIHGDFIFQNMLYVDSVDDPLALIDWEFSGVYYRSFDYAWFLVMSCVYELCDVNDLPTLTLNCPNERYFLLYSFLRLLLRLSQVRHRSDVHSLQELRFTRMLVNFLELYKLPPLAIP